MSPEQILAAAASEFAERGYAGARVDRIARRAAVNKAMLYYHFASKRQLYRILLRGMFARAADRLNAIARSAAAPADKIDRVIAELAALIQDHPVFPAIMMREVAERGAHLDRTTLAALAAVPRAVAAIVKDGVRRRAFRPIHPVFAYFSLLAPIVFYLAGTPIRKEISTLQLMDLHALSPHEFVRAMQDAARRSFARGRRARRAR